MALLVREVRVRPGALGLVGMGFSIPHLRFYRWLVDQGTHPEFQVGATDAPRQEAPLTLRQLFEAPYFQES